MSRGRPPDSDLPEPAVRELQGLYREAARAEPDAALDRRILAAARAEVAGERRANAGRPLPWWQRWLPLSSAVALLLVGLSLAWRVMDEQERDLREEIETARSVGQAPRRAAPAERPAEARPAVKAPAAAPENSRRAEPAAQRNLAPAAPEPVAAPAAAPAAMAPPLPAQVLKKGRDGEADELRQRRDAGAAADAAAGTAVPAGKLEAKSLGAAPRGEAAASALARPSADSSGGSPAQPAAATAEAWLQQIRDLRAAGRDAEAAQSLARFRARYPDFVLPDDLLRPR